VHTSCTYVYAYMARITVISVYMYIPNFTEGFWSLTSFTRLHTISRNDEDATYPTYTASVLTVPLLITIHTYVHTHTMHVCIVILWVLHFVQVKSKRNFVVYFSLITCFHLIKAPQWLGGISWIKFVWQAHNKIHKLYISHKLPHISMYIYSIQWNVRITYNKV